MDYLQRQEKGQTDDFSDKTWTWLRKETKSLLIAQNNAIRTNFLKAKIDKTLQSSYFMW